MFYVERRGRDRKGRGEKKRGEGKVKDGGVSAWGFQRGDAFWLPFLSDSFSQTGVSGASPVVIGFLLVLTRLKPVIGGLFFQRLVFQVFYLFKELEFREWVKEVNHA